MHTGLPAIADDSGLEVDALDGAPGIYSSRYAQLDEQSDSANNSKLLNALKGVENRSARFRCVLVYMSHANDPSPIICNGCWEGAIAHEYKGDNGFGYDPVFLVPELALHAAELEPSQKKQFSHRGQALQKLHQAFKSDKRYNIHPSWNFIYTFYWKELSRHTKLDDKTRTPTQKTNLEYYEFKT